MEISDTRNFSDEKFHMVALFLTKAAFFECPNWNSSVSSPWPSSQYLLSLICSLQYLTAKTISYLVGDYNLSFLLYSPQLRDCQTWSHRLKNELSRVTCLSFLWKNRKCGVDYRGHHRLVGKSVQVCLSLHYLVSACLLTTNPRYCLDRLMHMTMGGWYFCFSTW